MITNHFDNERRNLSNVTMMPIEYWISARIFRIRSSVACSSLWPHLGCWRQRWLWMAWRWRPWWRTPQPWGTRVRPGSRDKLRFFFYRVHFKQILYIFFNNLYNNSFRTPVYRGPLPRPRWTRKRTYREGVCNHTGHSHGVVQLCWRDKFRDNPQKVS